jgi:hypothetical protein
MVPILGLVYVTHEINIIENTRALALLWALLYTPKSRSDSTLSHRRVERSSAS